MVPAYTLRPATPADDEFLYGLVATARTDAAHLAAFPGAERESLLRNQFELQRAHYRKAYPDSQHDIILVEGDRVGRLWIDWDEKELRGLDIALLPHRQRAGLGTRIVEDLQAQAAERGVPMTICVEHNNPSAKRLYLRLGFQDVKDLGMHMSMVWHP